MNGGNNFNEIVGNVCYQGIFYVNEGYNINKVKEEILKKKIHFVPVLDSEKKSKNLLFGMIYLKNMR